MSLRGKGLRKKLAAALLVTALSVSAGPASADEYDDSKAGHPLRIIAYILHPIGVAIDYLIMRPAHWIGSHEPIATLVGHEEE